MRPTLQAFLEYLRKRQREDEARLATFRATLDADPLKALRRGTDAFEAAAFLRWTVDVQHALTAAESKATLESVDKWLAEFVASRAASPEHSSSPTSNLLDRYELAAAQHLLSVIRGERF